MKVRRGEPLASFTFDPKPHMHSRSLPICLPKETAPEESMGTAQDFRAGRLRGWLSPL